MGHFSRECRSPRNQESRPRNHDNGNKNKDSSRRTVNVEETSSKAMVAIDGAGFDWSFMVEEEVTTNMALMAFSDSKVYNDKTCSNTCLKSFETLKTQLDNLRVEFNKFEFNLATYKRGLASVEEQLVFYKKNEVIFSDQIVVLKNDASFKDSEIIALKSEIENLKKEKKCNQIKIDKFENASKCLDKLIGSQISDNSRKGVGYNAIPPPPRGLFAPLTIDLSNFSLEEFQQPEFKGYGPKASKSVCVDTSNEVKKTPDTPLVEELVSEKEKQTIFPTKIEFVKQQDKTARKPVKVNYNYTTNRTHPNAQRNMVPRAVLMKTGLKPFNTARTVNTALPKSIVFSAKPMSRFSKSAQSTVKRPYQSKTVLTNKNFSQKVNTARPKAVNTARPKAVNTARPNSAVVNTVRANQANAVKASACWGNPPTDDQGYVDSGCSRHMTGNISYLSDFQEFDGGYVTFGGGVRGGKITGKGTLKTGKLDFQDVYFVKELQFNLFSVSQMCDKKNCVLFTDTACFVLSLDFKLLDESQILLKVPRKNNIYSVDMKNIVPKESLTRLVANATLDESMLWHRRLSHVNFKTINKLVKDNLVRGLPSKRFENDQTCVACLKGKQHKALSSKDETSGILKIFITKIENIADKKVKIIRCDNGTEFKNRVMNEFYEKKGIKRESSNRIIIVKPYNKTPYELFRGRTPALSFMRPFGCHVSILNTLDHLGKFDGKSDDGYFVGYSLTSKAFRVYNIRTKRVEENLHIRFLEDKPIVSGDGPKWLFDLDSLTKSMNYVPIIAGTNSNDFAGSEVSIGEGSTSKETNTGQYYIVMPLWKDSSLIDSPSMNVSHDAPEHSCDAKNNDDEGVSKESGVDDQEKPESSTPNIHTAGPSINTACANLKTGSLYINTVIPAVITTRSNRSQTISDIFSLRDNVTSEATHADLFSNETKIDMSNLNASYQVPTTPNTRIHKDHSLDHVIGDI
ncbi:putative ribonuclease H-like domain-containing protein [Tanacetum coccineum]|uniref:Ribonuclease H-like domain-containing protein n=1 Tax=Tanacetum coccineum TaxID=301880 RepID=A0ABQ5BGC1_9ASTR